MATLVFDIETVGENWSELDDVTRDGLTRWVDRASKSEEEKSGLRKDIKEGLGFSPLTGYVVAIGLYDIERKEGAVYYTGERDEKDETEDIFVLKQRSEREMLEDFWEGAGSYDTFVTFNGRGFDMPFLLHRSVAHNIKPTVDLLGKRYLSSQKSPYHVDLQDELTFYGAMWRKPSLHLFCRAYGIESPKGEVGGDDVAELFREKKFRDIARYNARDVIATTELYERWLEYLAPPEFVNKAIDF